MRDSPCRLQPPKVGRLGVLSIDRRAGSEGSRKEGSPDTVTWGGEEERVGRCRDNVGTRRPTDVDASLCLGIEELIRF